MSNYAPTSGLVATWVTTVDASGRARLETRWSAPAAPAAVPVAAPTTAPVAEPVVAHAGHAA